MMIRSLQAIHGTAISVFSFAPISITAAASASELHSEVLKALIIMIIY